MITKNSIKSYCILGRHKETNEIYGHVENSFNMSLSKIHTRLYKVIPYFFSSGYDKKLNRHERNEVRSRQDEIIKHLQSSVDELNNLHNNIEFFIVRVNSCKCPVWFDWKSFRKAKAKYERRNIPFKVKELK